MKRIILFLCALALASQSVANEACKAVLLNDFRVSSKFLEVSSAGTPQYEIRQGGQLTVGGTQVELDREQQVLAEKYAGDVGALASQWIALVSEALEMIDASLESAFGEAFGKDSAAAIQSGLAIERARQKFESISRSEEGAYTVSAYQFNELGKVLGEDMKGAIKASVGALFVELGEAMGGEKGTFEERMETFGRRMEVMGAELEQMGATLEGTGDRLCQELRELQKLERRVADEIPELAGYPLFGS